MRKAVNTTERIYKQDCRLNGIYQEERRRKRGTMEEDEEEKRGNENTR